ncbi:LuxR family two component transcriptional regulator [Pontibacter ummariensis]|uniref:Two component transcriptional regulator, LuxR family n=1 Tax=Pontibacter ummariensis TaxID=1610492 RepID=A0A239IU80_9BACT|nr:response regulator transcription factor [Pontibacter ummariensis]PRY08953.1 LuxR family two component transcriptional regulator [Pontibacter ummariensis]SNS96942.1 two component transcriptional regulator, LuxR family [Pontibacter ummariensis]
MQTKNLTKVALVDDHTLFRKGILGLINGFRGYTTVLEADNGKEFTEKLTAENTPDIVLLDISMPVMDGFETAAWLQEHYPHIKILTLSMNYNDETVLRMLKRGVDGYILKHAEPSELRTALEALRSNGTYYSDRVSEILKNDLKGIRQSQVELTEQEIAFLQLISEELPYKTISSVLDLAPRSVDTIRDHLFKKLKVRTKTGLAIQAFKRGLLKCSWQDAD